LNLKLRSEVINDFVEEQPK